MATKTQNANRSNGQHLRNNLNFQIFSNDDTPLLTDVERAELRECIDTNEVLFNSVAAMHINMLNLYKKQS